MTLAKKCPDILDYLIDKEDGKLSFGNAKKINLKCIKCGSEWNARCADISNGRRCPYCAGKRVNHTNWAYSNRDMQLWSVDKEILKTATVSSMKKNKWKCIKCESVFESVFAKFNAGQRCPYCCPAPKKANYTNWAYDNKDMLLWSVDKEILKTVTVSSKKKNKWKCIKCESIFESKFSHFNSGSRCSYCCPTPKKVNNTNWAYSNRDMLLWTVDKEILKTVTVSSHKKNKWKCIKCKSIFDSTFSNFTNGNRCPYCSGKGGKVNRINWAYSNEDMLLWTVDKEILKTVTTSSAKKNKWKCPKCSFIFTSAFYSFNNGNRCPKCCESKGEKLISEMLDSRNLIHKRQYRIPECRNKKPLPFDHAILDSNNNLKGLIEFQGIQHFQPVKHWGGRKALKSVMQNDLIKSEFCKQNNIPLLVITYEHSPEEINSAMNDFLTRILE